MITIIISDDHTILRQGLRKMLEEESDLRIVGEAKAESNVSFDEFCQLPEEENSGYLTDRSPIATEAMMSQHQEPQDEIRAVRFALNTQRLNLCRIMV